MTASSNLVFVARLTGTSVFDPNGDPVGKVRDVVVAARPGREPLRVVGLVVEVPPRRRIFVPTTRVTSVAPRQVVTTGLVNMRRFQKRPGEILVVGELLDRSVAIPDGRRMTVYDVGIAPARTRDWLVVQVAVHSRPAGLGRRREQHILDWDEVTGLVDDTDVQGAGSLLATLERMRPADLAGALRELSDKRRAEVAAALDDDRLADVIEELEVGDQREILAALDTERAADVLEAMGPDDAADLLGDLPPEEAEALLRLMEPDEAAPVRQLLRYEDDTAGGLMTTEPVILPPGATVAEALDQVRNPDLSPALASMVYVCRSPLETPTGRYLGVAHIQALLREPPSEMVSGVIDTDLEPFGPEVSLAEVAAYLARYNLVAAPVVDADGRLLGAVSVDDVLDHLLGTEWRAHGA